MLEKTLESPLDGKEIKLVNAKGNQLWIFTGRTEAEIPILWPPDMKSWFIRRLWCWKRLKAGGEGTIEDEMVRWHHRLNRHEFEQIPGNGEGRGSLASAVHGVANSRTQLSNWTTSKATTRLQQSVSEWHLLDDLLVQSHSILFCKSHFQFGAGSPA